MRLWTVHPSYLDAAGLVAAWREGLLAQKVLGGGTKGYARHPQLERFKGSPDPRRAIAAYLRCLLDEARARGYSFDESRIAEPNAAGGAGGLLRATGGGIPVNEGQIRYELELLRWKLERRSLESLGRLPEGRDVRLNAVFSSRPGPVEPWEKVIEEVAGRLARAAAG